MPASLTITGPGAMVAAVPSLLGFHPSDSAVVAWLSDGAVLVTQRADLAPALADPDGFVAPLFASGARPDAAVLILYPAGPFPFDPDRADDLAATIGARVALTDVLVVSDGRWRSTMCEAPDCCPPEGTPVDYGHPLAQELAVFGPGAPLSSRDALVAAVTPAGTVRHPAPVLDSDAAIDAAIDAATASLLDDRGAFDPATLAHIRVRDVFLRRAAARHDVDPRGTAMVAGRLAAAVRDCHPSDAAAPAVALAAVAYMAGDGATALAAVDVATAADPGNTLAPMIGAACAGGIPPAVWVESLLGITEDVCRRGNGA